MAQYYGDPYGDCNWKDAYTGSNMEFPVPEYKRNYVSPRRYLRRNWNVMDYFPRTNGEHDIASRKLAQRFINQLEEIKNLPEQPPEDM